MHNKHLKWVDFIRLIEQNLSKISAIATLLDIGMNLSNAPALPHPKEINIYLGVVEFEMVPSSLSVPK